MFGKPPPTMGNVAVWLENLRLLEPSARTGELIRNGLLTDCNVCATYQAEFCRSVGSPPAASSPEDARARYTQALGDLAAAGCRYSDPPNAGNAISFVPFSRFARVVPAESFLQFNVVENAKMNRRLLRGRVGTKQVRQWINDQRAKRVGLRGAIGRDPMFATDARGELGPSAASYDADEIRNGLGLDNASFTRDRLLVILWYSPDKMTGHCYRPTVLDAGWSPAFKPSAAGPAAPGRTQHLATGRQAWEEVIHAPVAARELDDFQAVGPLKTDPSQGYK